MQSRIDRLEGLVLSLMSGNHQSPRQREGRSSSSQRTSYPESHDGDEEEDDDAMGHDEQDESPSDYQGGQSVEDDDVEEVRNALGIMKVHGGKSFYRGGEYWAAILLEVCSGLPEFSQTL